MLNRPNVSLLAGRSSSALLLTVSRDGDDGGVVEASMLGSDLLGAVDIAVRLLGATTRALLAGLGSKTLLLGGALTLLILSGSSALLHGLGLVSVSGHENDGSGLSVVGGILVGVHVVVVGGFVCLLVVGLCVSDVKKKRQTRRFLEDDGIPVVVRRCF